MKNITKAINEVEYQLNDMVRKALWDKKDSILINLHHARSLLTYLQLAKGELDEINADQNPEDYQHLEA
jgi:hypothetical protein